VVGALACVALLLTSPHHCCCCCHRSRPAADLRRPAFDGNCKGEAWGWTAGSLLGGSIPPGLALALCAVWLLLLLLLRRLWARGR
jgi:hypothetical protein